MSKKYTVLRDTREQKDFWDFPLSSTCSGTVSQGLKTGDYTLLGYESLLTIERKRNTAEFATNISEARFERELQRLEAFTHPYLILEFSYEDMLSFPRNSGIPAKLWPKLKVGPGYLLKRYAEIDTDYKTKIILAGNRGAEWASLIFRTIVAKYKRSV